MGERRRSRGGQPRWWRLLWLATISIAVVGLLYAAALQFFGDSNCPNPERDSSWGEFSWSLVPPGPQCEFSMAENGIDKTEGPGPVMSIWLVYLVTSSVVLVRTRANRSTPEGESTTTSKAAATPPGVADTGSG